MERTAAAAASGDNRSPGPRGRRPALSPEGGAVGYLLAASGCLLASGILLVAAFLMLHGGELDAAPVPPLQFSAQELRVSGGTSRSNGERVIIDPVAPAGGVILSTGEVVIAADRYPYLQYSLPQLQPGAVFTIYWRTRENPTEVFSVELPQTGATRDTLRLASFQSWSGEVRELGVGIAGHRGSSTIIGPLALTGPSGRSLLASVWTGWTAFEGWHGYSINFIWGGSSLVVPQPVPAVAAWVGVATLFYVLATTVRRRRRSWQVPAVLFMVGWGLLDLRWQVDMLRQVQDTRQRFAGKSWEQKHRAAVDGALFAFIEDVKQALPPEPQRIFLVTARGDDFVRLRSVYHLLPHNVFAAGDRLPQPRSARIGDYILLLEGALDARYDPERQVLVGPGRTLPVVRVFAGAQGVLYRAR